MSTNDIRDIAIKKSMEMSAEEAQRAISFAIGLFKESKANPEHLSSNNIAINGNKIGGCENGAYKSG